MNILVKFPTRSRGEKFLNVLQQYVETIKDPAYVKFLITYDLDDDTMNESVIERAKEIAGADNITLVGGYSKNKIDACNRDMKEYTEHWDIVMLASDDMIPVVKGWDVAIRLQMQQQFPDTDGLLWFNDGRQARICTMTIMGRVYYERFNYLYHPAYISLWCDNELTDVAKKHNRLKYYGNVLFRHDHPMHGGRVGMDELYHKNEKFFRTDQATYQKRKTQGFPH